MLILNKNILTIGGNRLEGGPLTPPTPPGPSDEVTIGTQTWKTANLAVDDGQGEVKIVEDSVYGTLYYYTQYSANRIVSNLSGWHLPSESEWTNLFNYCGGASVAGTKLKSTTGWYNDGNGTDDYGFCALPLGCYWGSTSKYKSERAFFRTSTQASTYKSVVMYYFNGEVVIGELGDIYDTDYCPVRLIKDT